MKVDIIQYQKLEYLEKSSSSLQQICVNGDIPIAPEDMDPISKKRKMRLSSGGGISNLSGLASRL